MLTAAVATAVITHKVLLTVYSFTITMLEVVVTFCAAVPHTNFAIDGFAEFVACSASGHEAQKSSL